MTPEPNHRIHSSDQLTLHPAVMPSPPAQTILSVARTLHQSACEQTSWPTTGRRACCRMSGEGPSAARREERSFLSNISIYQPPLFRKVCNGSSANHMTEMHFIQACGWRRLVGVERQHQNGELSCWLTEICSHSSVCLKYGKHPVSGSSCMGENAALKTGVRGQDGLTG